MKHRGSRRGWLGHGPSYGVGQPIGGGRGIVSERGVNFVDKDMEEGGGLVVWIRLYLRVDLKE